jgi:protein associated with RNAse G/E
VLFRSPKIDGLRHFFTKNPQFLGRGSDGAVFDVGEFILKIFRDPVAYQAAEAAMHRLHKEPELAKTEAMIYDAGKLGVFRNKDVFYYVMEKMIPISNIDLDFKNKVKDLIRKISIAIMNSSIKDLKGKSNIRVELDSIVEFIASYFNNSNLVKDITEMNRKHDKNDNSMIVPFLRSEWLRLLVEEICLKYLTGRIDLHVDNIGITNNGELRYFDSAYGGWEAIPDGLHMGYGEVISGK